MITAIIVRVADGLRRRLIPDWVAAPARLGRCPGTQAPSFAIAARAAITPAADAWTRPRVTPAPSPAA